MRGEGADQLICSFQPKKIQRKRKERKRKKRKTKEKLRENKGNQREIKGSQGEGEAGSQGEVEREEQLP